MRRPRPIACALATAAAALLLLPAAGSANVTFGSRLVNDPSDVGCETAPCSLIAFTQPSFPNGDMVSTGAPVDGVITVFRIRAQADADAQVTFRVADITVTHPDPSDPNMTLALATAAGTGPTVTIPGTGANPEAQTFTVAARLPVKAGQHLALDSAPGVDVVYASGGCSRCTYVFNSPLVDGEGARGANSDKEELLVQADIEPDADHDGFGDETQDQCPADPAAHVAPCPPPKGPPPHTPPDTTPPAVHGLLVASGRIGYSLSEAATVAVRIDQATSGRRVHGTCVRATAKNRRARRCTRFVTLLHSVRGPGSVGADRLALPRPHGRKLRRGVYRLTLTARDAAGNATTIAKQFKVR